MGIHDIAIVEETFYTRDGTWEASPHGAGNCRSGVLDVSSLTEAVHFPDGYAQDGIPLGRITANGRYAIWDTAAVDGSQTLAGFLYDCPIVQRGGVDLTLVMCAVLEHGFVVVSKVGVGGATGTEDTVTASDLPALIGAR